MPIEILMPALSPTMEEGTLAKWLVKEGDTVSSGDLIAEIETDKATMEFEAVDEGVVGKILITEGSEGREAVNTPIAVLLEDGESADDIGVLRRRPCRSCSRRGAPAAVRRRQSSSPRTGRRPKPPQPRLLRQGADGNRIFASPLARRIAADKGLDLSGRSQGLRPPRSHRQGRR